MGLKLSTAFSLLWSLKHRLVLPKVSHSGSSSLFQMLFKCSAILPGSPLSFFDQKPCTPSLPGTFRFGNFTATGYHIRCYLWFPLLVIPNVILDVVQPFRTPIMHFTYTQNVSSRLLTFVRVRVNILILSHAI